jgi:hypothetical protein
MMGYLGIAMGFRGIERVTGAHHTTVIYWVKQVGELLPDAYELLLMVGVFIQDLFQRAIRV